MKLSELLKQDVSKRDAIGIERLSLNLKIRISCQDQEISVFFEDTRDFNLAVCMLQKSGFYVRERLARTFSVPTLGSVASSTVNNRNSKDLGPRLSSITPLPDWDLNSSPGERQATSFTSMLESPLGWIPSQNPSHASIASPAPITGGASVMNATYTAHGAVKPTGHSAHYMPAHLNPYNVFVNRQDTGLYRPLVGSPLRNTFYPARTTHSMESPASSQESSIPSSSSQEAQLETSCHFSTQGPASGASQDTEFTAFLTPKSRDLKSSSLDDPNSTVASTQSAPMTEAPEAAQNFRKLMPRPRTLPFGKRKKEAEAPSRDVEDIKLLQTSKKNDLSKARPKKGKVKSTDDDNSGETTKSLLSQSSKLSIDSSVSIRPRTRRQRTSKASSSRKRPAELICQPSNDEHYAAVDRDASTDTRSSANTIPTTRSSPQQPIEPLPLVLIAERSVLQQLNHTTSAFFEQYEGDVKRGCDEFASAQFYLAQIEAARRAFWLAELSGTQGHAKCLVN